MFYIERIYILLQVAIRTIPYTVVLPRSVERAPNLKICRWLFLLFRLISTYLFLSHNDIGQEATNRLQGITYLIITVL